MRQKSKKTIPRINTVLKNSFQHIPGIGARTEQQLWDAGICDWSGFPGSVPMKLSSGKRQAISSYLEESDQHLHERDPGFFSKTLPADQHWRIFKEFRNSTAYIDIETTGLEARHSQITTIALYDGNVIKYYVNGRNLDSFIRDINEYQVIVSYNGKTFDVPFIEHYFRQTLTHAHIDLRYVLKSLGFSGGLKRCEKAMGIDRGDLEGVDGYFAVLLWFEYQNSQNEKALETLLAYNIEDVVNLETLMVNAYNMKLGSTPFSDSHRLPLPGIPEIPFKPHSPTVNRIRRRAFYSPDPY